MAQTNIPARARSPGKLDRLYHAALALLREGRVAEAEPLYRAILASGWNHPPALHHLGLIRFYQGRLDEAIGLISAALVGDPGSHEAHYDLATALQAAGRAEQAMTHYCKVLALKPDHADAVDQLGVALASLNRLDEAVACHRTSVALAPRRARSHVHLGNALVRQDRHREALEPYDVALALDPRSSAVHNARGHALHELDRWEEAVASFTLCLALDPADAVAENNLGTTLRSLGRSADALAHYAKAIALKPDFAEAHYNQGTALQSLNRLEEACVSYRRAQALKPDYAEAHWNEALSRLTLGEFGLGWPKYEWRWKNRSLKLEPRPFTQPLWSGAEPLAGRTILLHAEQGLGDTIQFLRYVPLVAKTGAHVVLELQPTLLPLLAGCKGVATLCGRGETLPPFDVHCPLPSLPLAFGTRIETIPAPRFPHRITQERLDRWQARIGPLPRPRVGLVWAGNPGNSHDFQRSMPLESLWPLLCRKDICLVSLQKDLRDGERPLLAAAGVTLIEEEIADFADTAAILSGLDLVIAVDTSVAHLAGALGMPVWIMLAAAADWRWAVGRPDCPWYPTAQLFRQPEPGDWGSVVGAVGEALTAWRLAAG